MELEDLNGQNALTRNKRKVARTLDQTGKRYLALPAPVLQVEKNVSLVLQHKK